MFIVDRLRLLGLNPREARVFTALSTFGRMNMANVASRSNLPRTTVHCVIHRLADQGLIDVFQVKRHKEYEIDLVSVTAKLTELSGSLNPIDDLSSEFSANTTPNTTHGITVIEDNVTHETNELTKISSFSNSSEIFPSFQHHQHGSHETRQEPQGVRSKDELLGNENLSNSQTPQLENVQGSLLQSIQGRGHFRRLLEENAEHHPNGTVLLILGNRNHFEGREEREKFEGKVEEKVDGTEGLVGVGLLDLVASHAFEYGVELHLMVPASVFTGCADLEREAIEKIGEKYANLPRVVTVLPDSQLSNSPLPSYSTNSYGYGGMDIVVGREFMALISPFSNKSWYIADYSVAGALGSGFYGAYHTGAKCNLKAYLEALIEKSANS